ncbi:helix-turn-helix domain-containing protein [Aliidiomarina maris]|uniref:Helix-turn-helix protein n=1 Tax=Aliidiomarina maris TaxID=531312 RepID=A0A327X435_9GAMM|nr:helix-turn-helix domain-containing protein [Aliidiomarina maris]RAK01645.1 helix-turn-helix protein [Aliidiomarina maris]RUO28469.1 hypothetical protein CWE07_01280 [Aliidiomarina maris]
MPEQPLTMNHKEAAQLLGISERTLYDLRKAGVVKRLPQFKSTRYSVAQLRKTFEEQSDAA